MSIDLINNAYLPKILVSGDTLFKQEIYKLLDKIQATSIGQDLLTSLSSKGFVRIFPSSKSSYARGNNVFFDTNEASRMLEFGRNELGDKILYLPHSFVILFHELVHVWLSQNNIEFNNNLPADDKNFENKNEELCITGKTGDVSVRFFENALLEEIHCPHKRISWDGLDVKEIVEGPLKKQACGESLIHTFAEKGFVKGYLDQFKPLICSTQLLDDYGSTPLHYAGCNDSPESTVYLLNIGLSPEMRNHLGITPFANAVVRDNVEVVKAFLSFGISIEAQKSVNGKNIFEYCQSDEMEQLLLNAGFEKNNKKMRLT